MNRPVFALIDCNNFFVSCERIFRPDLADKPTVVLSSNDGCVVARSNEVKALGVPMAAPAFKYRDIFNRHGVVQFSANFELYGDISRRITDVLTSVTPHIEIYSVDESFLDLSELNITDFAAWGRMVHGAILRWVGVPVSIGIASTKTLAKLASEYAKKHDETNGVVPLFPQDARLSAGLGTDEQRTEPYTEYGEGAAQAVTTPSAKNVSGASGSARGQADVARILQAVDVKDVWGIGWRMAPRMRAEGIMNAFDLSQMRPQHIQQLRGIQGRQLVAELNGASCYPLEQGVKIRQSIARTRTFGEDTNDIGSIESAITTFATQAAFRLRVSGQVTQRAAIFLATNKHKPGYQRWTRELKYNVPTADTGQLIASLMRELTRIYHPNQHYYRAGVFLWDFLPADNLQTDLLGRVDVARETKASSRMATLDTINEKFGKETLRYASQDLGAQWRPRYNLRSPRYTTKLSELPNVQPI